MQLQIIIFSLLGSLFTSSLAFPITLPTSPNPSFVFKRGTDPGQVPTVAEFQAKLSSVPAGNCVFYSDGGQDQARVWAQANGKIYIFDADESGWAGKKPAYEVTIDAVPQIDYNPDSPMSSGKQNQPGGKYTDAQTQEYFENVSSAFTLGCSGDVAYLVLPYKNVFLGPASDNIFVRVEKPLLESRVSKILVVETGSSGNVVKGPWEWWPNNCNRQTPSTTK